MKFTSIPLKGAYLIELETREDTRGFFARSFCREQFRKKGLDPTVVQANYSFSRMRGTLRGLHYQLPPEAETKLVRCLAGALYDVILDLRQGSPTFGKSFGACLSAKNRQMMYVPRGFAHGFLTLEPATEIMYFVSANYSKVNERGIRWNDPTFAISWPKIPEMISERDQSHPDFDPEYHLRATPPAKKMHILFTGASSFTGMWFVKELSRAGHRVTAPFLRKQNAYQGLRQKRLEKVLQWCSSSFSCPFGSERFLKVIEENPRWDLFCHHAADVTNYKSPDFDYISATKRNTKNLKDVLVRLKERGCSKLLLTGSVFEQGEGEGSQQLRAVSPYGLSKGLTSAVFQYLCQVGGFHLGKFVIPNPFGPYEEPRFTSYLIKTWFARKIPLITTPDYRRDNIPVSLLAKAYCAFAESLSLKPGDTKSNPSFYIGKQKDFVIQFAKEMEKRLFLSCQVEFSEQTSFDQPHTRINNEPLDPEKLSWNETLAWDELAAYYQETYG